MSAPDDQQKLEASRWLKIAVDDRAVAELCLTMTPPSMSIAAYHCQQSVEKLLKGLLVLAGVHFRKTHDLRTLADLVEANFPQWRDLYTQTIPLTGWGYAYRYPGLEEEPAPSAADILAALGVIDQLINHVRDLTLPSPI